MITAVRLLPQDKRRGFGMKTYVSAASRTKYTAGTESDPSPFRLVKSDKEVAELQRWPQFQILQFDDMDHLREFIQNEMEERARKGYPAVRAAVMAGAGAGSKVGDERKAPTPLPARRLPSAVDGPDATKRINTGRRPSETPEEGEKQKTEPQESSPAKKRTKAQLLAIAKRKGLEVNSKMSKSEVEELLKRDADKRGTRKRSMRPSDDD